MASTAALLRHRRIPAPANPAPRRPCRRCSRRTSCAPPSAASPACTMAGICSSEQRACAQPPADRPCSRSAMMSARVLQADRETHHVGAGAGGLALLVGELAMGGGGGVDDQAADVADVGQVREQLDAGDELHARLVAALQAEGEDRAGALGADLLDEGMIRVLGQARVVHPRRPACASPGAWRRRARSRSAWPCAAAASRYP